MRNNNNNNKQIKIEALFLFAVLRSVCDIRYLGFVIVMMKFIISSVDTTPSLSESASLKILAGTPREEIMR